MAASIRKRVAGIIKGTFTPNDDSPGSSNSSTSPTTPSKISPLHKTQSTPAEHQRVRNGHHSPGNFITHYLNGSLKKRQQPQIYYGKTGIDLPKLLLEPFTQRVYAAHTGPDGGLSEVPPIRREHITGAAIANLDDEFDHFDADADSICSSSAADVGALRPGEALQNGSSKRSSEDNLDFDETTFDPSTVAYNNPHTRACGASVSLYEHPPNMKTRSGDPVADCFGIVTRHNHCLMALADGVNWGHRARLAAQCAVRGALDHLQIEMQKNHGHAITNTQELFHVLLGAFHAGHQLILQEGGLLTTLCVAVVCKLKGSSCWVICACNVGDSLCFVHSKKQGTREVTLGSHDISSMRNMRDAGGALGPVDGVNPELNNLTCSMTFVDEGDIVFITSDGISDNFDPVVGKFCMIKEQLAQANDNSSEKTSDSSASPSKSARAISQPPQETNSTRSPRNGAAMTRPSSLPVVSAHQRHELMLLRMDDLLQHGISNREPPVKSSRELVNKIIDFVTQLTRAKRAFLEDADLYISKEQQKRMQRQVRQRLSEMPGKLDHATVVAYTVGLWSDKITSTNAQYEPPIAVEVDSLQTPVQSSKPLPRAPSTTLSGSEDIDNTVSEVSEIIQMSATVTGTEYTLVDTPVASESKAFAPPDALFRSTDRVRMMDESVHSDAIKATISCELHSPDNPGEECVLVVTHEQQQACDLAANTSKQRPQHLPVAEVQSTDKTCVSRIDISIAQQSREILDSTVIERRAQVASASVPSPTNVRPMNNASYYEALSSAGTLDEPSTSISYTAKATSEPPAPPPPRQQTSNAKRKKHARGTGGRHTLAVDIQWLKRLMKTDENADENVQTPQRNSPAYRSDGHKKWRSKLRLLPRKQEQTILHEEQHDGPRFPPPPAPKIRCESQV